VVGDKKQNHIRRPKENLTGRTVGKLTVIELATGHKWWCRCACGKHCLKEAHLLRTVQVKSCGCLKFSGLSQLRHGHAPRSELTPTYRTWRGVLNRCLNRGDPKWMYYGARGIGVCERWRTFENFLADMGERPHGTSIDRIDNTRGYEPGNCRWATWSQQCRNRRFVKLDETKVDEIRAALAVGRPRKSIAADHGVSVGSIHKIALGRNWR
jgi:hypothetical protein